MDFKYIASRFLNDSESEISVQKLGNGLINTTLKAVAPSGIYVIQKLNTSIFTDPTAVMSNTILITDWIRKQLQAEGIPPHGHVLEFLPCKDGGYLFFESPNDVWRCSRFIDGATAHLEASSDEMLYEAGKGYGEFQKRLNGFPTEKLVEVLPGFHNTRNRYKQFLEALNKDTAQRVSQVREEVDFFLEREAFSGRIVGMLESGALPYRVTHNDTKMSNVMIDDQSGKAVCVIDLDTIMPGTVLYDFGDAIRSGAASAAEDEQNLEKMNFLPERYEAFKKGFLEACGDILTETEKKYLALGALMIVFEQAMRFFTDYLNGDTYYQIQYPEHNLIRARTQIRLFSQMETLLDWE